MVALTIVTIGTSLPEIAITVSAAWKREASLAIGNIIGTNIFNICIALGLPVAIFGSVSLSSFSMLDCVFMIIAVVTLWLCSVTKSTISRREGIFFMVLFAVYYALTFLIEY
jgi:cation:H+ antiporter